MRLLPYGPRAVLAEFSTLAEVMAASSAWRQAGLAGVIDVVPAARTVLVMHDGSLDSRLLVPVTPQPSATPTGPEITVDVTYDGAEPNRVVIAGREAVLAGSRAGPPRRCG